MKDSSKDHEKNINTHAKTVAETLLTLEYCVFWIGVPLIRSNKKRNKLSKQFFQPIDDFIKCSMVSVPTQELQVIFENFNSFDLNDNRNTSDLDKLIYLPLHDKVYFPVLSTLVIFAITTCSVLPLASSLGQVIYGSMAASLGAAFTSSILTLEHLRRNSFKQIIAKELNRRKGNIDSGNKISIMKPTY